jgi:hypothetical protein
MLTATLGSADVAVRNRAILGEGPTWDQRTERLIWVDIIGGSILFYDPATGEDRAVAVGQPVGSVAPRRSGGLVAATSGGISLLTPEDGRLASLVRVDFDTRRLRMNDGKCDPLGRSHPSALAPSLSSTTTCKRAPSSGVRGRSRRRRRQSSATLRRSERGRAHVPSNSFAGGGDRATVHVFVSAGRFRSLEERRAFIDPKYTEDGDGVPSCFMREVELSGSEPGCIEAIHRGQAWPLPELSAAASYTDQWAPQPARLQCADDAICMFEPNRLAHPARSSLAGLRCNMSRDPCKSLGEIDEM